MTIREKLADWISGGALSEMREKRDDLWLMFHEMRDGVILIQEATASGKSGTAKKIHRMASEALK